MASSSQDEAISQQAKEKLTIKDDVSMSGSDSESEDEGDEEEWMDVDAEEDEKLTFVSLVDDTTFDNMLQMLAHCKEKTGLDFVETRDRLALDFVGCIKLVNLIRGKTRDKQTLSLPVMASDLEADDLMLPVLPDDTFIMSLDDLPEPATQQASGLQQPQEFIGLRRENAELKERLQQIEQQFMLYRESVAVTLDKRWGIAPGGAGDSSVASGSGSGAAKTAVSATQRKESQEEPREEEVKELTLREIMAKEMDEEEDNEIDYFDSYAGLDIHETMLKDKVRTEAYRDFIYANKPIFAGKTVLDVGCGTGILSMFAARAGAARVIAVDNSNIVKAARANVTANDLDGTITVIHGKVEEVALPVDKVDIIVSEWMGYCLTYEAMLPSVLWARDRYLREGGLMVPSHATLRLAPVSGTRYVDKSIHWWADVYGFDMAAMANTRREHVVVTTTEKGDVAGDPVPFRLLDLHTVTVPELEFTSNFETRLERGIDCLEGWVIWFDIFFASHRAEMVNPEDTPDRWIKKGMDRVAFTTGPEGMSTHWEQGLCVVKGSKKEYEEGDDLIGTIQFKHATGNRRHLGVSMKWESRAEGKMEQKWMLGG